MREHFIVMSISSREVARAQRTGVRHFEDSLKVFNFGDSSVNIHADNLDAPATSILEFDDRIVPCGIFHLLSLAWRHSFLEASAFVLLGPRDLLLEHMSGSKRPVGIAQEFASQQDDVRLPGGDDVLCLFRCGNHAHGSS